MLRHSITSLVGIGLLFLCIRLFTSPASFATLFVDQIGRRHDWNHQSSSRLLRQKSPTDPDPTLPTIALAEPFFRGGFRNQAMRFNALVMQAREMNIPQILLPSIRWGNKDLHEATPVLHEELFDVEYWNTFYPSLPRLVTYDPSQHYQWDASDRLMSAKYKAGNNPWRPGLDQFLEKNPDNRVMPYAGGGGKILWHRYRSYSAEILSSDGNKRRDETETLIYNALIPSRKLREKLKQIKFASNIMNAIESKSYLALHARVETEMVHHGGNCEDLKEFNFTKILSNVEDTFVYPFPAVFLPMERRNLIEGARSGEDTVSVDNLKTLTRLEQKGMWEGNSPIFDVGSQYLKDDGQFQSKDVITGQIMNFYIAVESDTFVGTPISTWSTDVWTVRYFRGKLSNFIYLPGRLKKITAKGVEPRPYWCMRDI